MIVVINAVAAKMGGAATYIRELARELARRPVMHRFIFYVPPEQADVGNSLPSHMEWRVTNVGHAGPLRRMWWDQIILRRILRREGADALYSSASFGMFFCPVPQLLLVRNSLYFSKLYHRICLPQRSWYFRAVHRIRRWLVCQSARVADKVMVPSSAMLKELQRGVRLPGHKIAVNSYGGPSRTPEKPRARDYTGTIRLLLPTYYGDYKNMITALEAMKILSQRQGKRFQLVTTASPAENGKQTNREMLERDKGRLEELKLLGAIETVGSISYTEMLALYAGCHVLIWPTLAESFGHPLVEAMEAGLPIVASDIPVNRELARDAALYFDPLDPVRLASQVENLVGDATLRTALQDRGWQYGQVFSWQEHAARLVRVLESLNEYRTPAIHRSGCAVLPSASCPLCQSSRAQPRYRIGPYWIKVCMECGLSYTEPMPNDATRASVYKTDDYYTLRDSNRARVKRYADQRLDVLERLLGGPGTYSLLDIGCASGIFLQKAQGRGWSVTGIEQSERLATEARRAVPGSRIYTGKVQDAILPLETFDVVCLWEVLEHNPSPVRLLRPLVPLLRPQGILALSTPNINSWAARLLRDRFPMLTPPEHVLFFSPTTLEQLVQKLDGRTIYWRSFGELLPEEVLRGLEKLFPRLSSLGLLHQDSMGRWALRLAQPALEVLNRLGWGIEIEWYVRFPVRSAGKDA